MVILVGLLGLFVMIGFMLMDTKGMEEVGEAIFAVSGVLLIISVGVWAISSLLMFIFS